MRLPDAGELAHETIAAAAQAGITVFDTAHAYGREPGGNERLLAAALRSCRAESTARVVTKGGMTRPGGAWVPDGRAKSIVRDCEASLDALGGLRIDLYLIHAPDVRTPWRTSVRALARLADEGLVARVGLSNVNRAQLDEALELAPIAAVEVALSLFDDRAVRGGVVERCAELGIAVIAHSPLGGLRRALAGHEAVAAVAAARAATPAEVALAWLLGLSPNIVAIPGARRPETARSAARAAALVLSDDERTAIRGPVPVGRRPPRAGEVIVVMGIPGAGKSAIAQDYVARGYRRLNRDERGGSLRGLAMALDEELASGQSRVVLDNTYLTRAARSYVIEAARRYGVQARCVWLDTPLAQAQVNLVERLLARFDELPTPAQLRAISRREPGMLSPTSQMRAARELEPPSLDEGWADLERVAFVRTAPVGRARAAVLIAARALEAPGWERSLERCPGGAPYLVFDWSPDGAPDRLEAAAARLAAGVSVPVESALCPHPAGPPICWCRPPLPGLPLAFARRHGVDPARCVVIGTGTAHRTLAATLGADYVPA